MTTAPAAVEPAEEPEESPALPWAELAAEHFQLLRLAALPTDRNTGARPLRFVQFGYAERHDKAHSLLRMEIRLPGRYRLDAALRGALKSAPGVLMLEDA